METVLNLHFFAGVSQATIQDAIRLIGEATNNIRQANLPAPNTLVLRISSPGGSSDHGLLMYNFLRQLPMKRKITIGMGNVDSAAVLLFLACDERFSVQNCRYLVHEAKASGQYVDMTLARLKEQMSVMKGVNESYARVISERTGNSLVKCKGWVSRSGVMSAEVAKERGFLSEVLHDGLHPSLPDVSLPTFTVTITDPNLTLPTQQQHLVQY